jgi:hypothetical protein
VWPKAGSPNVLTLGICEQASVSGRIEVNPVGLVNKAAGQHAMPRPPGLGRLA